jgi:hypothetical protein
VKPSLSISRFEKKSNFDTATQLCSIKLCLIHIVNLIRLLDGANVKDMNGLAGQGVATRTLYLIRMTSPLCEAIVQTDTNEE